MIQLIRKKKGISQRELACKAQISRGRLKRLEKEGFEDISIAELRRISQVLNERLETFFEVSPSESYGPGGVTKSNEFPFVIQAKRLGFKISSYTIPVKDFFIGKIFLAPGKVLEGERFAPCSWIFLQTLLGMLKIELPGKVFEVSEGHHLLFRTGPGLCLKTPRGRESVALLFASPSFLVRPS